VSRGRSTFGDDDWGGGKRRVNDADLDITPMIDVTFLLLIFFMVASTMQKRQDMNVPAARSGQGADLKDAIVYFIASDGSRETVPEITDDKGLSYTIDQFASRVRAEAKEGKTTLILQVDGRVPAGFRDAALRSLQEIPNLQYHVGVREKREP
jgi:biopolymer transport protein ExbD